jgi:hypothetical protein
MCKEKRVPVVVVRNSHYCNADVSRCVGDGRVLWEGLKHIGADSAGEEGRKR